MPSTSADNGWESQREPAKIDSPIPVLLSLPLRLSFEEAIKYHGLRCRGLVHPRTVGVLRSLVDEIHQRGYFEPKVAYHIGAARDIGNGSVHADMGHVLAAPVVAHHLRNSSYLLLAVCTLGARISQIISQFFQEEKRFQAIILEELTNYALFKLSGMVEQRADLEASEMGLTASGPVNPGDDGFDLSSQSIILDLANASEIDVSISPVQMMAPRHSLSVVHGLGANMRKWSRAQNCETCKAKDRCRHRHCLKHLAGR